MPDAIYYDGNCLTDNSIGVKVLIGPTGRYMAPVELTTAPLPNFDGDVLQYVRQPGHQIQLPVIITAASENAMLSTLRTLAQKLNVADKTLKQLKVVCPDGRTTYKNVIYNGGLEFDEQNAMPTWKKAILIFNSVDAFWTDSINSLSGSYSPAAGGSFFPIFPMRLSNSQVFAQPSVTNLGDVTAWPTWTFTGPGTNPTIRNSDTGEVLSTSLTLGNMEKLIIYTQPSNRKVVDVYGNSRFSTLVSRQFFGFDSGVTNIQLEMGGADQTLGSAISFVMPYQYLVP